MGNDEIPHYDNIFSGVPTSVGRHHLYRAVNHNNILSNLFTMLFQFGQIHDKHVDNPPVCRVFSKGFERSLYYSSRYHNQEE